MCVAPAASIRDALTAIDDGAAGICLVVDADGGLVGVVTDGDIRRALLRGAGLESPIDPLVTTSPYLVDAATSRAHVLDLMRAVKVNEVPVVDSAGRLTGLHTLSAIVGRETLPNVAVVMAGGRGTRLGELTRDRPKPLMMVAGRTILEWIVLNLVSGGIRDVYVSVNYLADQVESHLADGSHLGCRVSYLREEVDRPLGTAGALALLAQQQPEISEPLVVMNGDLMVQFSASSLLSAHQAAASVVTVATREYQHQVPYGVVTGTDDGRITGLSEKPTWRAMVNAGVYAVSAEALRLVPKDEPSTMPGLVDRCLRDRLPVGAWPIESDWIDVGTPRDLARAKGHA
jgi:dTDP-glucose pyrophosphorylase